MKMEAPPINKGYNIEIEKSPIFTAAKKASPKYALFALISDFFGTIAALCLADVIARTYITSTSTLSLEMIALTVALWISTFSLRSIYDTNKKVEMNDEIKSVLITISAVIFIFMGMLYLFEFTVSRPVLGIFFFLNTIFLVGWRIMTRLQTQSLLQAAKPIRVLIFGGGDIGKQVAEIIMSDINVQIVGFVHENKVNRIDGIPVLGTLKDDITTIVKNHKIDEVIMALPQSDYNSELTPIIKQLQEVSVSVRIVPSYINLKLYRNAVAKLGELPLINLKECRMSLNERVIKRIFDMAVSSVALIAVLPALLMVAIAIKLDSKGPILFKQERVGENGKHFKMYKFRSMVVNAEALQTEVQQFDENGNVIHKVRNDPRVTRIGRFIRKTSLDELPQLLNVFMGDMSLVGPRPELPWLVEEYQPWQFQRLSVPQGITGWWQINGRSDKPMHLNTNEDVYYVQNYSLWLDLQILFKTVPALLKGKGAF